MKLKRVTLVFFAVLMTASVALFPASAMEGDNFINSYRFSCYTYLWHGIGVGSYNGPNPQQVIKGFSEIRSIYINNNPLGLVTAAVVAVDITSHLMPSIYEYEAWYYPDDVTDFICVDSTQAFPFMLECGFQLDFKPTGGSKCSQIGYATKEF